MQQTELEEEGCYEQRQDNTHRNDLHRNIPLGAGHTLHIGFSLIVHFLDGQSYGSFDDSPRFDDTNYTGSGNTADTDVAGIGCKDFFGTHAAYRSRDGVISESQHICTEDCRHHRDDDEPNQERTGTYN